MKLFQSIKKLFGFKSFQKNEDLQLSEKDIIIPTNLFTEAEILQVEKNEKIKPIKKVNQNKKTVKKSTKKNTKSSKK